MGCHWNEAQARSLILRVRSLDSDERRRRISFARPASSRISPCGVN
jgi:hypothetical protein